MLLDFCLDIQEATCPLRSESIALNTAAARVRLKRVLGAHAKESVIRVASLRTVSKEITRFDVYGWPYLPLDVKSRVWEETPLVIRAAQMARTFSVSDETTIFTLPETSKEFFSFAWCHRVASRRHEVCKQRGMQYCSVIESVQL